MSNIAPFVAAALRDQVVVDLHEENQALREENRRLRDYGITWTVLITGQDGSPVFAKGTLSHHELLTEMISSDPKRPFEDISVQVDMEEGEKGTTFHLSSFQNFWLVLEIENCLSAHIAQHTVDPDHMAFKVSDESFKIRCLFGQGVLRGFRLNVPIPRNRLDGLAPELRATFVDTSLDAFLSLAEDTMGNLACFEF